MEQNKVLQWVDVEADVNEVVKQRNSEYMAAFEAARVKQANLLYRDYIAVHPQRDKSDEEYAAEVKEYILAVMADTPDELTRNMRIYSNLQANTFNLMNSLIGELADFKEIFIAVNKPKIEAYAKKLTKELAARKVVEADTDI